MSHISLSTSTGAPVLSRRQTDRMLLGLGLVTFIEFYTFDAVNLVLPDMAASFGASPEQASWILTVFSTALFLGVPLSIWLASYVSHLRYILSCAVLFVIASLGCALSRHIEAMLFWRAVQGFAGAGLSMWWRASIYLLLPREQRSGSLMRISVMLYLSSVAGLLFSGYVTDHLSWRLIFLPNIVMVAIAIPLLKNNFPDVPASTDPRHRSVDVLGVVLIGITIVCLQIVLSRGEADGWFDSSSIQALSWSSAITLLLFIYWQTSTHNRTPLLQLQLMRSRPVLAAVFLGIFAGIILSGSIFALPEFLRNVYPAHLSATRTGAILCAYALVAACIRPLVTKSIAAAGQRKALVFALLALVVSMLWMASLITLGTPDVLFIGPLIVYAFCLTPLLSSVGGGTVAKLPQAAQLDGVAIYMTFRQLGASLGVTLVSGVLHRREQLHSARLAEHLSASNIELHDWITRLAPLLMRRGGQRAPDSHAMAWKLLAEHAMREAAALAYADAFLWMAAVGGIALCFVPLMNPSPVAKK